MKLILYKPAYPALSVALNLTEPVALNLGTVSLSARFLFQTGTVLVALILAPFLFSVALFLST